MPSLRPPQGLRLPSAGRLPSALAPVRTAVTSGVLATLAVPPLAPPRGTTIADPKNALLLFDLVEKVLAYDSNNEDPNGENPTLDDVAEVAYEFVGADGRTIGTTKGYGRMLYQRPDGGFVAYFSEEIKLQDGNVIRTGGLVDDSRLTAGEQATINAVGVAGPFRGAVGFRQFRPVVPHKEYQSNIVLYRR
ncbi:MULTISPECIES: allene oxide cyclase barrel-like domain-containing protein [Protofrankia]|uniref:allene oxide cyclase barrel-like domain-containing protein n=1 Tax=Protofrankia TaxID=2994361 RepID=UPI000ABD26D1|nr:MULTISPECIES: hypothetical protein [Protofrankia]